MSSTPRKIILGLRFMDANVLSPIPEIASSACISPEISPEPILEPTSKSAKLLSPSIKLSKMKKSDRREINIRIQKKLSKLQKTKKKNESILSIQEIDSHAIYLKNKNEIRKLFPEAKDKKAGKDTFINKSPQRPEMSQIVRRKSTKKDTLPKCLNNNIKSPTDREGDLFQKFVEGSSKYKVKPEAKNFSDIIEKYSKKRGLVNSKLNKITELASEEIRTITKSMINKKS